MRANNLNIDDQLYLFVKPFEYLCQVNKWQIVDLNLTMLKFNFAKMLNPILFISIFQLIAWIQ